LLALSASSADRFPAPNANGAAAAGVAFVTVAAAAVDKAGFEAPNEKAAPVLGADTAAAGFSVVAAAGFGAPKENAAPVADLGSDAAALAALGAPKENAGAAAVDVAGFVSLSADSPTSRLGRFFALGELTENVDFGSACSAAFDGFAAPNANAGLSASEAGGLDSAPAFGLMGTAEPNENAGASVFFAASSAGFFSSLLLVEIGLAALKAKVDFGACFGDSTAGFATASSVGWELDREIVGLLLRAALRLGVSFADEGFPVPAAAAANSNVGKSALAAFSRWLSGFAEPRGVIFGSAKINALTATSGDVASPKLGRDLREDDPTVLGRVKLSSDLVGDVDHFCGGLDVLLGFPISGLVATCCFASREANIEPGGIGVLIDPAAFAVGEDDAEGDLRGSLVFPTELSENTGGPASSPWPVREAAAGVALVSTARVAGRAERGMSRLPRRIPPALRRDDNPLDFVVDAVARDLDLFVAGGDVIRSKVSKIFRLVSWATGTIAVDAVDERSPYGALRLSGR
jgi:hypothetical protein